MQTPETIKRSIGSAEDLANVVRTMKTMAAVSIRQYEAAVQSLAVYSRTIETGLRMLLPERGDQSGMATHDQDRVGAIIFGSDQGMCGQFNEQIALFTAETLSDQTCEDAPTICVGFRAADKLKSHGLQQNHVFRLPGSAVGITSLVHDLLTTIDEWRAHHNLTRILVFHNRRMSASTWTPHVLQLLPLQIDSADQNRDEVKGNVGRSLPFWTMDTNVLLSRLVKQFLFISLFRACAESQAGENASRIAAMQSAERNIKERLHDLRATFAQQRQTTITEELLDVVTGFEALSQEAS